MKTIKDHTPIEGPRLHGKKPDVKIRHGMSAEEIEDCADYCLKHDIKMASLARKSMLTYIGKTPTDIKEGDE